MKQVFLSHLPDVSAQSKANGDTLVWNSTTGRWVSTAGGGGSGTVTSVSVTTANGVSGTVATATTTPAISLTLGAITPTSVAASGAVSGINVPSHVWLTGTVANSANPAAWADVTGLSFTVVAGTYLFEFEALTVGSATTNWARFGVNGPTTSLLVVNVTRPNVTAGTGNQASTATAYDTGTDITTTNTSGSLPVRISGVVTFTASGTFILRQRNTTAGAAVTVNAGSWGRITRIN